MLTVPIWGRAGLFFRLGMLLSWSELPDRVATEVSFLRRWGDSLFVGWSLFNDCRFLRCAANLAEFRLGEFVILEWLFVTLLGGCLPSTESVIFDLGD